MKKLSNIILGAVLTLIAIPSIAFGATLIVPQGGTGITTCADGSIMVGSGSSPVTCLTAGANGTLLRSNGSGDPVWVSTSTLFASLGTVSSVDMTVPTGFAVSGNPITTSGTLGVTFASGYEGFMTSASTTLFGFYNTPSTRITDGTGLTWSSNTLNVDASQSISTLSNLTSNGFVKTSGGTGALSIDTSTYLTTVDISANTNLTGGVGLTLTNDDMFCDTGSSSVFGCLATADWTIFNNKVSSTSIDTSAELASLVTDETGTAGSLVFSISPTFTGLAGFTAINVTSSSTLGYASSTALTVSGNTILANATSTNHSITNATGTNLYGFGLSTCNGANQAVNWSAGKYGCASITGVGDGVSNWLYNGSRLAPSTTVGIGVFASSTIGGGTAVTGLTINGGATTTGNHVITGSATSTTSFFSALGTFTNSVINTLLTAVNATITGVLTIPNGTGNTCDDPGEICWDTSDEQLVIDDRVFPSKVTLFAWSHGSTSPKFATSSTWYLPTVEDGYVVTDINCKVTGGTSKPITLFGETLTCDTNGEVDDGTITIATIGAGSTTVPYTMGAGAGNVNDIIVTVSGRITRE